MRVHLHTNAAISGRTAALLGAKSLREALRQKDTASIILATGASQFEMLRNLLAEPDIDWSRVAIHHLDEYVDLPASHPASFRKYLQDRFISQLPDPPLAFHAINGEGDLEANLREANEKITGVEIDVAFIGIGENGHLAFNDPPADFETQVPYIVVHLDEACRRQQFGEGWFPTLEDVPTRAISMTISQILKSRHILCTVPDERKAMAVRDTLEGPVTNQVPASILQQHESTDLFLDEAAASLLS